jgi:hypothetical protein
MADTGENGTELQAHAETWQGFTALMKWGTVASALVAALVVFLIAS